jgi:hypothetical protein
LAFSSPPQAIESVAVALEQRGMLTGDEVDALLART